MNRFLKEKLQFALLAMSWVFVGVYLGPVIYGYLPISILLLKRRQMFFELFFGFLLILVLSDSRHAELRWTGNLKDIYIVLLAAFVFFDKKNFGSINGFYLRFLPFILVALFCTLDAVFPAKAFQKAVSYLLLLVIAPNYIYKLYKLEGDNLLRNLVMLGTTILTVGILLNFINPKFVNFFGRYCGVLGNPNGLGIYTMLNFLLFSTVKSLRPNLFEQKEKNFIYAIIVITLILCGSRSAIIALLIFLIFNYFNKMSPVLGIIMFFLILLTYQFIENNLKDIILAFGLEKYFRLSTIESGSGRIVAWAFAWKEIQNNFFIGRGFSYTDYVFEWNYLSLNNKGHNGNAHNSYLTLWLDTGLVGLVFYMMALIVSFVKAAMTSRIAVAIMYALLFQIFFESWLAASLNPFTILLIIILFLLSTPDLVSGELYEKPIDEDESEALPSYYPQRFVPR